MMNAFFKDIDFSEIKSIGFDMDGTLYDEYDFIIQPYKEISKQFKESNDAFNYMTLRWLEKGSSYNKIFDETYEKFVNIEEVEKDKFIKLSLNIFRNFEPKLVLSNRVKTFLNLVKNKYKIFLVSDGNFELQKKKFISLGLDKYFTDSNIIFTGKYSKSYEKPNIKSLELLDIETSKTIFFGDRPKDKEFAKNSKMKFQMVYNMMEVYD